MTGRLFLGVPIPDDVRKKLKQNTWQSLSKYKKDRMTPAHNWHFTLAFMGQMPVSKLDRLKEELGRADWGEVFKLGIKGYGAFPGMEAGRVLWLGASRGTEDISQLATKVRTVMDEVEVEYDGKPFVPHLTLCRMKVPRNLSRLSDDYKMKQETVFPVERFVLYQSHGGSQKYTEVLEIPLKDQDRA